MTVITALPKRPSCANACSIQCPLESSFVSVRVWANVVLELFAATVSASKITEPATVKLTVVEELTPTS